MAKLEGNHVGTHCPLNDMNIKDLRDRFAKSVHYSRNSKSYPSGDVPAEIWRIMLNPQWVLPTVALKWGIGHTSKFETPVLFENMFEKFLSVMYNTKCLPVQAVMNVGAVIPKKKHVSYEVKFC